MPLVKALEQSKVVPRATARKVQTRVVRVHCLVLGAVEDGTWKNDVQRRVRGERIVFDSNILQVRSRFACTPET